MPQLPFEYDATGGKSFLDDLQKILAKQTKTVKRKTPTRKVTKQVKKKPGPKKKPTPKKKTPTKKRNVKRKVVSKPRKSVKKTTTKKKTTKKVKKQAPKRKRKSKTQIKKGGNVINTLVPVGINQAITVAGLFGLNELLAGEPKKRSTK